jgi:Ca-activated chloride channel family protein
MSGFSLSLVLFAGFLVHAGPQTDAAQSGEFKISTEVRLVLLDVSVTSRKGGYVSGLTKNDFHVYENGITQPITVFSNADVPVTVGLVIDDSGSMKSKRPEVVTAGLAFAGVSNPRDEIFIVNFDDTVRLGLPDNVPFSDNAELLRSALSQDRPEGRTSLYDAISSALNHLESGRRDKKALVVISDGDDNASKCTFPELLRLIQESRATIYTVGIFELSDPDRNPGVLKRIAAASGGECFLPGDIDHVVQICKKIAKDIRSRYTIGYTPARTDSKPGLRRIRVEAVTADHEKLAVRTRSGYSLK